MVGSGIRPTGVFNVFDSIRSLFESAIETPEPGAAMDHQLATAALLMEMAHADTSIDADERNSIRGALERAFELSPERVSELMELAEAERDAAVCLHGFTRTLMDRSSLADRVRIIEMLWRVALADGDLDRYEEHLVRKLAELLHVSHSDYIRAKLAVTEGAH